MCLPSKTCATPVNLTSVPDANSAWQPHLSDSCAVLLEVAMLNVLALGWLQAPETALQQSYISSSSIQACECTILAISRCPTLPAAAKLHECPSLSPVQLSSDVHLGHQLPIAARHHGRVQRMQVVQAHGCKLQRQHLRCRVCDVLQVKYHSCGLL